MSSSSFVGLGEDLRELDDLLRGANAGDDILPLGVDQNSP